MPYFTITDFAAGLDLRRSALTAPAGTLRSMLNCHVTPGGEIEKRMAFVPFWNCDPASKGLVEVNQKLYAFGPNGPYTTDPPAGDWSVGVLGQATTTIYEIIDYDLFDNKVFVILWKDNVGTVGRYYAGDDLPLARGFYCRTYKNKMYTVERSILYFSAIGNAGDWSGMAPPDPTNFIDLSMGDSDMTDSVALEVYYDKLAVFSSTAVQLWIMDPDFTKNQYVQTLRQAGTTAWRSVLQYGSGDVMYLSQSGVRSLRARNSSLAAAVSDIGSPLDPLLQDLFRTMGEDWMSGTIALLQPVTGRFWIIMAGSQAYAGAPLTSKIYVLSAFPGPKITAWSEYDAGFVITAACLHKNRVVVRDDNNKVYAYGGISDEGPAYDDCPVELIFPFHAGEQVATSKTFVALDATCAGMPWDVSIALNVEDPDVEDYVGQFNGPTFPQGTIEIHGVSTHMSLRLRSEVLGPQTLSNMVVHYQVGESDMIEISPADRGMVQAVIDNMRADDRAEMLAAGTDLLTLAHLLIRHSTFTFCAWGYDCGPISVWGLARKRPGVCSGYAFGTDDWPRAVLPMVRQIRGFILPFLVDNGIHRVDAVALRRRDDVRRFMSLVGAKAEAVLTGYGADGEDFVSYRWLSDEYGGYQPSESEAQAVSAHAAH